MTAQITGAGLPTDGFLPQAGQQQAPAGGAPRPVALMLLYPELTLLDLIGPHTALAPAMDVHLVAETLDEVVSDTGVAIRPTTTLAGAPRDVDVLFVPGGPGTVAMMSDVEVLDFLADRGPRARYVTSVCSGSLILGAAGLLEGYRAGCHWTALDLLPLFGAQPSEDRVVTDRNRVTGGGVTAGIRLRADPAGADVRRGHRQAVPARHGVRPEAAVRQRVPASRRPGARRPDPPDDGSGQRRRSTGSGSVARTSAGLTRAPAGVHAPAGAVRLPTGGSACGPRSGRGADRNSSNSRVVSCSRC
jgi:putative intracellular protease/amidase